MKGNLTSFFSPDETIRLRIFAINSSLLARSPRVEDLAGPISPASTSERTRSDTPSKLI